MHGKKGFTLVELCAVMAVVAVVGTMIVTFVVWTANQNNKVKNADNIVSEMASFQTSVESLLSKYDNSDYSVTVEEQKITIIKAKSSNVVETLTYSDADKAVKNKAGGTICELSSCQTLKFEPLTDGGSTVLIKCEIVFNNKNENKNESQLFYFSIHNNIVRERFISPSRPRKEE